MNKEFDTALLKEEALEKLYYYQKIRGQNIFSSFVSNYRTNQKPKLEILYQTSYEFQAIATRKAEHHYQVIINHPVIYLLRSFFDVLMSTEPLGQKVTNIKSNEIKYVDFNFIPDVNKMPNAIKVKFAQDQQRMFVASTLCDFCITLIILHEIGHIVCGHVETHEKYFNDDPALKMINIKDFFYRGRYLKLGMERDADAVSARIIAQYVRALIEKINTDERHQTAFKGIYLSSNPNERLIGLISSIIFAFFTYMHSPSKRKDYSSDTHPHPFLRVLYIKDIIVHTIENHIPINQDLVSSNSLEFYDCIDESLDELNIYNVRAYKYIAKKDTSKELRSLADITERMRRFSSEFSWLPQEEWI